MKSPSSHLTSQKKMTQEKKSRSTGKERLRFKVLSLLLTGYNKLDVSKASKKESKKSNNARKIDISKQVFPLQASRDDIIVDFSKKKKRIIAKGTTQYIFEALYKSIPVLIACLYKSSAAGTSRFREAVYKYELNMSNRLAACRGMNTHLYSFVALMESQHKTTRVNVSNKLAFCMVLPSNGTILKDYIEACGEKYKNEGYEPIHPITFVQIAISLFAMLRDAHLQRIGLLNINVESLKIGVDQTLYFDQFKWCLDLDVPTKLNEKEWIQVDKLECPEREIFKEKPYHESADVFAAAAVLSRLIRDPNTKAAPFIKKHHTDEVSFITNRIRPGFKVYESILKRCLSFDPKARPTASELLSWFEKQRRDSFSNV